MHITNSNLQWHTGLKSTKLSAVHPGQICFCMVALSFLVPVTAFVTSSGCPSWTHSSTHQVITKFSFVLPAFLPLAVVPLLVHFLAEVLLRPTQYIGSSRRLHFGELAPGDALALALAHTIHKP